MKDFAHIEELEALSQGYCDMQIDFVTYKEKRRKLLNEIDNEQNGAIIMNLNDDAGKISVLSKAMAFLKSEFQKN